MYNMMIDSIAVTMALPVTISIVWLCRHGNHVFSIVTSTFDTAQCKTSMWPWVSVSRDILEVCAASSLKTKRLECCNVELEKLWVWVWVGVHNSVADPGFPRRVGRPIILQIFCQKLLENERNWTLRGACVPGAPSMDSPMQSNSQIAFIQWVTS